MFLPCSIELDLPPSYLKSKSPSKEIIQKKNNIKITKFNSEDIGRMMILSPKIRHWKKKAQNKKK